MKLVLLAIAAVALTVADTAVPPAADPATVTLHVEDADRFAAVFAAAKGAPSAAELQARYLDPGSYGVTVFTPGRIADAARLSGYVAQHGADYRDAIDRCLPIARTTTPQLRSIYRGLHALYPTRPLPQIYLVFGAGNSGGTAGPGAQAIGLEVACRIARTPAALRATLRNFYAHETVHTWQREPGGAGVNPLLEQVLVEGAADYVASLATGAVPDAARAAWATPREAMLWRQFTADMAAAKDFDWGKTPRADPARVAMNRWIGNYGSAPKGWPYEAGYWIGMRIWQRYVAAAPDKAQAMRDVLDWRDADAVLARGRFREK